MNRRRTIMFAIGGGVTATASASSSQVAERTPLPLGNPEMEEVRALLKAHNHAVTNHDINGVLECLTEKPAIMGTGPGEIWSDPEEITNAYRRFFEAYDKGQQNFEYDLKISDVSSGTGWLMACGNIRGTKQGMDFSYPLNVSLSVRKGDGRWRIAAMHFSSHSHAEGLEAKPAN